MNRDDVQAILLARGIQPTRQRVTVASYVLATSEHPSADLVWERVRSDLRSISRATVYNTLHLFVSHGLIRAHTLTEGRLVFDPNIAPHHHFIDEETGEIRDVPWDAVEVDGVDRLEGLDVSEYQVVLRGRVRPGSTDGR